PLTSPFSLLHLPAALPICDLATLGSFPLQRRRMTAIPAQRYMLTDDLRDAVKRAQAQVNTLVLGKPDEVRLAFVALLSDGHLLIDRKSTRLNSSHVKSSYA